jgi:membrane-associated phospholipid phosphatase
LNGFAGNASESGFASNHVATAFALVTPFAQQHDMPWLYGLAAATSFGRVQKREHWVSDTVAGAFLGYAIGSMLTDQHKQSSMRLSVTPQSVEANWAFN